MRQSSFSLGHVFGIEVRVHATWLLAFAFVTWALANGYFRFIAPRQGLGFPLVLGGLSALLLFASVLVHEFSHSLVVSGPTTAIRNSLRAGTASPPMSETPPKMNTVMSRTRMPRRRATRAGPSPRTH